MPFEAGSKLVIGQWIGSPRLRALIDVATDMVRDEAVPALERLALMRQVDTAEGVWLDRLGLRLGLRRPVTTDPAQDRRFGFDLAGLAFDAAPFLGSRSHDSVFPLPDVIFRRLLRSRSILLLGDGTIATFAMAIAQIDEGADVTDQRNMTVRVVTSKRELIELADASGALPRTAGVRIAYADRERFGYDLAGKQFDVGAWT